MEFREKAAMKTLSEKRTVVFPITVRERGI